MEYWIVDSTYKILTRTRPTSDDVEIYCDSLKEAIREAKAGCGIYCPNKDAYLEYHTYHTTGVEVWNKCED